ncbi:unnamed protein product [Prunus brigantina]
MDRAFRVYQDCLLQFCGLPSISSYYVFASVTLNDIIQKNFPEEFAERKLENDTMTNFGVDLMPLFVMDVVLPFQKFLLLIF